MRAIGLPMAMAKNLHFRLDGKQPLFRRRQAINAAQEISRQRHAMATRQAAAGLEGLGWDFGRHYNQFNSSD